MPTLTKNVRSYGKSNINDHYHVFNNGNGKKLSTTVTDTKIKNVSISGKELMELVYGPKWAEFKLTEKTENGDVVITGEEIAKAINKSTGPQIVDGRHVFLGWLMHSLMAEKSGGAIKLATLKIHTIKCETYAHYYELAVEANAGNDSVTGTTAADKKLQGLELYKNMSDPSQFTRDYAMRVLGLKGGKAQEMLIICKHVMDFGLDRESVLKLNRDKLLQLNSKDKDKPLLTKPELAAKLEELVTAPKVNAKAIMNKTNIEKLSELATTVESQMGGILKAILDNDFKAGQEAVKEAVTTK